MVSPGARKSTLPSGARSPCLAVLSFTLALTVLLCAAAAPRVHAQTDDDPHKPTDDWAVDGTVLVSLDAMTAETRPTLTIREGESGTYWVRLSKEPPEEAKPPEEAEGDEWWVFVHVDGQKRADGYGNLSWIPSIGRRFHTNNWYVWKSFRITASNVTEDETYTFTHELWDHDAYCPPGPHASPHFASIRSRRKPRDTPAVP